jgi:hypothetical protein
MILALIGPHAVGKTCLGRLLAARLGLPFHEELGRVLAEDRRWRPTDRVASDPDEAFDTELFTREITRDLEWRGRDRVVETWHPGNLGYASLRSPLVAASFLPSVLACCRRERVLIQPLTASSATLARRMTEPGDPAFFLETSLRALRWAEDLGLRVLPPIRTEGVATPLLAERLTRCILPLLHPHQPPRGA